MTTPHERTFALHRTRQFLRELSVQPETRESIGLLPLEPWADGDEGLQRPFTDVVLGSI